MNSTAANGLNTTELTTPLESNALQKIISYVSTGIVVVLMLGMGCGVDFYKLKGHILKPIGIIVGIFCQFSKSFFLVVCTATAF